MKVDWETKGPGYHHLAQIEVPSIDKAFDAVVAWDYDAEYIRLEEVGPGDEMVPIISRVEVANG